ncbi:hypothetical protein C8R43DRAFT_1133981 [Mycena crocata]|nr:hypothetical protein C8R43DRAFT_1133981 [Mycena crocata]
MSAASQVGPVREGSAYRPSVLFQCFQTTRPSTPETPVRSGYGKPPAAEGTPPRFGSRSAAMLSAIISNTPTPSTAVSASTQPTSVAPSAPSPPVFALAAHSPTVDAPAPIASTQPANMFPESRPPVRAPPVKKTKAPSMRRKAAAEDGGTRRMSARRGQTVAADGEEEEGAEATVEEVEQATKRGRGRPRKTAVPAALVDTSNTSDTPPLIFTTTNNNRAFMKVVEGRRAEVAASKAAEVARQREAEIAAEAKRGWFSSPNLDGPSDTVTLRPTRTRKPAAAADGSTRVLPVKNTRPPKNPHAATEAALLARTSGSGKRKAPAALEKAQTKRRRST